MKFTSPYYKTIPELNIVLLDDIPIEDARRLAKFSQTNGTPIYEDIRTAVALKANKAFYTVFNRTHFLILVNQTHANVVPIPNIPLNATWTCYRHDVSNQWQWWSFGYGLPMMIESLIRNFGCNSFNITPNEITGMNDKNQLFVLSPDADTTKLPTIPIPSKLDALLAAEKNIKASTPAPENDGGIFTKDELPLDGTEVKTANQKLSDAIANRAEKRPRKPAIKPAVRAANKRTR